MPGLVKIVRAAKGDAVTQGPAAAGARSHEDGAHDRRPHDGVLAEIVAEGAQITDGTVLVTFEEAAA